MILSIITIFISLLAVVVSILTYFSNKEKTKEANSLANEANRKAELANKISNEANKIAMTGAENSVRNLIDTAQDAFDDLFYKVKASQSNPDPHLQTLFEAKVERLANAYDLACQKYLDEKLDRSRFKKTYYTEIKNIRENPLFKKLYESPSKFNATIKVYDEWFNLE